MFFATDPFYNFFDTYTYSKSIINALPCKQIKKEIIKSKRNIKIKTSIESIKETTQKEKKIKK